MADIRLASNRARRIAEEGAMQVHKQRKLPAAIKPPPLPALHIPTATEIPREAASDEATREYEAGKNRAAKARADQRLWDMARNEADGKDDQTDKDYEVDKPGKNQNESSSSRCDEDDIMYILLH